MQELKVNTIKALDLEINRPLIARTLGKGEVKWEEKIFKKIYILYPLFHGSRT